MELAIGTKFTFKGKTYIVTEDNQACTYCDLNQGNCLAAKYRDIIGTCNMISRKDKKNVVFKEIKDMENKEINIAEILKDKPQGTKLCSPICGEVAFDKIERDLGHDTIFVTTTAQTHYTFMEDGKYERNGECLLFPSKELRDWSKFAWKKGDVLQSNDGRKSTIFAGFTDDTYTLFKGKHSLDNYLYEGEEYIGNDDGLATQDYSLENKDAAQHYINTIERKLGGKLNMKTLEFEDIKPK